MNEVDSIEAQMARLADAARRNPNFGKVIGRTQVHRARDRARDRARPARARSKSWAERSLPPEREFDDKTAAQFAHAPERVKETLLDSAGQVAALEKLLRRMPPGVWAMNHDISAELGITHVNNVASKLRGVLDDRGSGEDVDSRAWSATRWGYRICLRSQSWRLQQENPSRRRVE